ncbi:TPA: hypothetical protein HA351_04065 [Methanosarcinaceae archaeon]|nr:hypothetical protein [Methanosarcinaceae archaeon]
MSGEESETCQKKRYPDKTINMRKKSLVSALIEYPFPSPSASQTPINPLHVTGKRPQSRNKLADYIFRNNTKFR